MLARLVLDVAFARPSEDEETSTMPLLSRQQHLSSWSDVPTSTVASLRRLVGIVGKKLLVLMAHDNVLTQTDMNFQARSHIGSATITPCIAYPIKAGDNIYLVTLMTTHESMNGLRDQM